MLPTRPVLCAAALLLSLAGCERRDESPKPPAPPPVPPAPAAVAPPAPPVPPPAAAPTPDAAAAPEAANKLPPGMAAAPPLPAEAEVEIIGALEGVPAGADLRVLVARTPCSPKDTGAPWGVERLRNAGNPSPFFIEVFVPQGATGHVCAYAVKDKKVVAFGTWEQNPITMRGAGEVMFTSVAVTLKPVRPAVAASAGL